MKNDLFSIKGETIVVTGGLGQIGSSYCQALGEYGANIVILDSSEYNLGSSHNTTKLIDTGQAIYIKTDITDKNSLSEALKTIELKFGTPHGLINNAGLDSPPNSSSKSNGPFETYDENIWDTVIDVNLKGVFLSCQILGSAMAQSGRGSIINIGSIYGILSPDQRLYEYRRNSDEVFFKPVAYSASKSGIYGLSRYLATYWANNNVRVNTLTLGGVFNNQDKEFLDEYHKKVPLGRMAKSEEYGGAIIFLLSGASSYMTGTNMIMDGGLSAW